MNDQALPSGFTPTRARTTAAKPRMLAAVALAFLLLGGCAGTGTGTGVGIGGSTGDQPSGMAGTGDESDQRRRARIRLELGASYYQQGNYNVALEELRQALAIEPEYPQVHGMLGLVYMDLGDRSRAEESFQRALRLAPGDSELNNNYGWYLCQTGREKASIEFFLKAQRNPLYNTPARPLHNAGICSLRTGDVQAAETYFQRSFQLDPLNAVAMYNLAEIYLKRRDFERARFYSQRLGTTFEPSAQVLWLMLRVERAAGNRDGEASLGLQLRRRFPTSPEAALLAGGKYGD